MSTNQSRPNNDLLPTWSDPDLGEARKRRWAVLLLLLLLAGAWLLLAGIHRTGTYTERQCLRLTADVAAGTPLNASNVETFTFHDTDGWQGITAPVRADLLQDGIVLDAPAMSGAVIRNHMLANNFVPSDRGPDPSLRHDNRGLWAGRLIKIAFALVLISVVAGSIRDRRRLR